MKKICVILLAAALLSGCGELHYADGMENARPALENFTYTPSEDFTPDCHADAIGDLQYHDGYVYLLTSTFGNLYRLNVETGNVTAVCPDPLCRHDTQECLFYGMHSVYYITPGGDICFSRLFYEPVYSVTGEMIDNKHINDFVLAEPDAGKLTVLETYGASAGFSNQLFDGDYRYFIGQDYNPETEEETWGLMRMDMTDGEWEWFGAETDENGNPIPIEYAYPCFTLGDRIYFDGSGVIFSLDKNGGNRIDHAKLNSTLAGGVFTDGEYLYSWNYESRTIFRMPINGGETEVIAENVVDGMCFTENYIYYQTGEPVNLGKANVSGYASREVVLEGGELHRIRHDGSEDTAVFIFDGEWAGVRPLDKLAAGNYLYCTYYYWQDADGDGVFEDGDNLYSTAQNGKTTCSILRIDLTTREVIEIPIIR